MKKMDDIFKQRLENHESEYSSDVWLNVEKAVFNTPKKPNYVLIGFWAIIGISISLGGLYFLTTVNNHQLNTTEIEKTINQRSLNETKKSQNPALSHIDTQNQTSSTTFVESSVKKETTSKTSNEPSIGDKNQSTLLVTSKNTNLLNQTNQNTQGKWIEESGRIIIENDKNLNATDLVKSIWNESNPAFVAEEITSIPNELYNRSLINPLNTLSSTFSNLIKQDKIELAFKKPQECPRFYKDIWVPYGFLEYGSMYPIRKLTLTNESYPDYVDARNQSEQINYSFDFTAGFGIKSPKGIVTEIGIQYTQLQEKFNYVDPESIQTTTVITIDTIITGGMQNIVKDTAFVDLPGSRRIVTNNKFRFVNFPLMIGYEKNINQSFSVAGKAGLILNFSFSQKGSFLDENNLPVYFSSNQLNKYKAYKSRIGLSYMLAAQFNYHLTGQITLYASPQVKIIPSSITEDIYFIDQTYINPALSLGVKFSI